MFFLISEESSGESFEFGVLKGLNHAINIRVFVSMFKFKVR